MLTAACMAIRPSACLYTAVRCSGVARNLIWDVLTSHCNFKTCVNVPHVNKTVTSGGYIYLYTPRRYAPGALTPAVCRRCTKRSFVVAGFLTTGLNFGSPPPAQRKAWTWLWITNPVNLRTIWTSVKVLLQHWGFTIKIIISVNGCERVKRYGAKQLRKIFLLTEDEVSLS